MGETKVERKVVSRTAAIGALAIMGISLVILVIGLIVAVNYYGSIINARDNTISSLNSQKSVLNSQLNDLTETLNLEKSTIWVSDDTLSQSAGSYTYWTPGFSATYAGYVSVWVQSSTTTNTYVRVIYSSHGVNYDQQITVGTGGTALFPVLPSSSIQIRVGNTNLFNGATETVTITYYY